MKTRVCDVRELIRDGASIPQGWHAKAVIQDDNMTYVAWNSESREVVVTDPVREDWDALLGLLGGELKGYRVLAVIDTHTHADHVSCAADLAREFGAPLLQHEKAPSRRVHLRVSRDMDLPAAGSRLRLLLTPGHTVDSITPIWGPFIFGGDTLLFGDTGRNDLPGGDPEAHWESLQKVKASASKEMLLLPGHDAEGGRVSSWSHQLETSPSLSQSREDFVREAGAYIGPSPKNLKESLYENFK
jgi:sulfur dioxygenase